MGMDDATRQKVAAWCDFLEKFQQFFIANGMVCLACNTAVKHPPFKWATKQDWSTAPSIFEVAGRGQFNPKHLGLCIITGEPSDLTVVDIDVKDQNWKQSKVTIDGCMGDVKPFIIHTPSGGMHYWFKYVPLLRNKAKVLPGVDIRGDGGLVVVPPSRGDAGKYRFDTIKPRLSDIPVMPESLQDELLSRDVASDESDIPDIQLTEIRPQEVVRAGERNMRMFRHLCYMRRKGYKKEDLEIEAREKNRTFEPPLTGVELAKLVLSASKYKIVETPKTETISG
jgi:hypothetical protein